MTFSTYGLSSYDVQYWDGSAWVTVTGGGITSNNKVWKKISFTALTTTKIRVWTHGSVDSGYSRITEVEAWSNTEASGTTSASINWLVTDQLGTPRMIFDKTGSLANARRHDYLPFGEELFAGQGGRALTQGYNGSDGVRQKFTQKERDIETGLDYFGARYYSPTQGRFTSSDKPFADQFQANPQSWNSYSYVRNSPCTNKDVKGRCSAPAGLQPGQVGICIEAFIATKTAKKYHLSGRGDGRSFSGDDESLTARVRTDIIVERTAGNSKTFDVMQKTTAGTTLVDNPTLIGPALIPAKGSADTKLNGQRQDTDGTSAIIAPIDKDGMVSFNISTIGRNGVDTASGVNVMGEIKFSLNLIVNSNTGQVGIGPGSSATGYPTMAVYSYVFDGKNVVTTTIKEIPEGSPGDLDKPMKAIDPVKPQ
jgi:RHS repeat-associated protein